jgi:hypothetical protein
MDVPFLAFKTDLDLDLELSSLIQYQPTGKVDRVKRPRWMPPKASVGAGGQLNSRNSTNQGLLSSKKNSTGVVAPAGDSRLKVVVRRCPPELPEELFWKTVEPWVNSDTVDWKLVS